MIVGENARNEDMDVNITKEKQLTNIRSSTSDNFESLTPPRRLTLEECLDFAREDECVEVTPEFVRLRKVILDRQTARTRHGPTQEGRGLGSPSAPAAQPPTQRRRAPPTGLEPVTCRLTVGCSAN